MRYDDPGYLARWRSTGVFPRIHDAIFAVASSNISRCDPVVDLCCSTGLLGERMRQSGYRALGIERDKQAIAAAKAHGVQMPIERVSIAGPDGVALAIEVMRVFGARAVLARRCFPELFAIDHELGRAFVSSMADAGIATLVLEGRVPTPRPQQSLVTIDHELALCSHRYDVAERRGSVACLSAR